MTEVQWEYLVETWPLHTHLPGSENEAAYLAFQGQVGWELVQREAITMDGPRAHIDIPSVAYYWKRRIA